MLVPSSSCVTWARLSRHPGAITALGQRMVSFPVHPRYARMLMAGHTYGCTREAALIAALTQDRGCATAPPAKTGARGPRGPAGRPRRLRFLHADAGLALCPTARLQAGRLPATGHSCPRRPPSVTSRAAIPARGAGARADLNERAASQEAIRKCVLTAFIDHLALRRDEGTLRCDLVHGRRGELARDSAVRHSRLLVAAEIDEIEHGNREFTVILRLATAVDEAWLGELFPEALSERTDVTFDATGKRVVSSRSNSFGTWS